MAKQLNVNLAFTADTGKAKAQLQDLQNQLSNLAVGANINMPLTSKIQEATAAAASLKTTLQSATDVNTGKLDLSKFSRQMEQSGMSLQKYKTQLENLGPAGTRAFASLATSIQNAEVTLKRTSTVLAQFKTTLMNTARWQFSSMMLHGVISGLSTAYNYSKDLNESLNNIRIVTGYNTDQMAKFAEEANKAAKALSTTTTEYTNASLIYYQQGLSDDEVQKRTDITIKMANVARESAETVSDQMTAVWNNFYDGSKSLEYYADVMTALGAATASSTDEIAEGLEKFAAIAESVGLSYEYATSALATVTATTRQSADVVGTAFKTLFARIQDLELGETLDDGVTLGKYSEALSVIGVNILDANNNLRDMDDILNDLGARWDTITQAEKVSVAQTVAGVRQYTQLIALMDNWDYFQENLATAKDSSGTLSEQAKIYEESWEAAGDRVKASAESIYETLLDDDAFIGILNGLSELIDGIDFAIDALGGLQGVLPLITTLLLRAFGPEMANTINNTVLRMNQANEAANNMRMKKNVSQMMVNTGTNLDTHEGQAMAAVYGAQGQMQEKLLTNADRLSGIEKNQLQTLLDINKAVGESTIKMGQAADMAEKQLKSETNILSMRMKGAVNKQKAKDYATGMKSMGTASVLGSSITSLAKENTGSLAVKKTLTAQIDEIQTPLTQLQSLGKEGLFKFAAKDLADLKQIQDRLSEIQTTADALPPDTPLAEKDLQDLQRLEQQITQVQEKMMTGVSAYAPQENQNAFYQLGESAFEAGEKIGQVKVQTSNCERAVEGFGKKVGEAKGEIASMGDKSVAVAQAFSSMAMAVSSVQNITQTIMDTDTSGGEKILSIFTSLAMVVPMVITSLKSLSATLSVGMGPLIGITAAITVATAALTAYSRAQQKNIELAQEEAKKTKEKVDAYREERKENAELIKSMRDALKVYEENGENKDELDTLTRQLAEAYNLEGDALARLSGDYKNYNQLLDQAIAKQKQQIETEIGLATKAKDKAAEAMRQNAAKNSAASGWTSFTHSNDEKSVVDLLKTAGVSAVWATPGYTGTAPLDGGMMASVNFLSGVDMSDADAVYARYEALKKIQEDIQSGAIDYDVYKSSGVYEGLDDFLTSMSEFADNYKTELNKIQALTSQSHLLDLGKIENSASGYQTFEKWISSATSALESAGVEDVDKAISSIVDQSLDSTIKDLYETYKAINEIKEINKELDKDGWLTGVWTNEEYDKQALSILNWGTVTKDSFDAAYKSAELYTNSLKAVKDAEKNLTGAQSALSSYDNGSMDADAWSEMQKSIDWGNKEQGIIEFSTFVQLTAQEQQAYLENLIDGSYSQIVGGLEATIEAAQLRINEQQQWLDQNKQKVSDSQDLVDNWKVAEQAYNDYWQAIKTGTDTTEAKNNLSAVFEKLQLDDSITIDKLISWDKETFKTQLEKTTADAKATIETEANAQGLMESAQKEIDDSKEKIVLQAELTFQNSLNRISDSVNGITTIFDAITDGIKSTLDDAGNTVWSFSREAVEAISSMYPGFMQGLTLLEDGSFQVSQNIYESFFNAEKGILAANTNTVSGKLANLAREAYARADQYEAEAQMAYDLAKNEIENGQTAYEVKDKLRVANNRAIGESNSDLLTMAEKTLGQQLTAEDEYQSAIESTYTYMGTVSSEAANNVAFNTAGGALAAIHNLSKIREAAWKAGTAISEIGTEARDTSAVSTDVKKTAVSSANTYTPRDIVNTSADLETEIASQLKLNIADGMSDDEREAIYTALGDSLMRQANRWREIGNAATSAQSKLLESINGTVEGFEDLYNSSFDKTIEELIEVSERYHEITREIQNQERAVKNLDKAISRTYGGNQVKLLKQKTAELKTQLGLENDLLAAQSANLLVDTGEVQKYFSNAIIDAETFEISNYTELLQDAADKLNQAKKDFTDSDQDPADEKKLKDAQDYYDKSIKALEQYETTLDAWNQQNDKVIDITNEIQDNIYKTISTEIEIKLDINKADMELLEYYFNKFSDDIYSLVEALAVIKTLDFDGNGKIGEDGGYVKEYFGLVTNNQAIYGSGTGEGSEFAKMRDLANSTDPENSISKSDYIKWLQDARNATLANIQALDKWDKTMLSFYSDTLAATNGEIEKQIGLIEKSNSRLEHYQDIVTMINGYSDPEMISQIHNAQATAALTEAKAAKSQYDFNVDSRDRLKDKIDKADEYGYTEAEVEEFKKQLKVAEEQVIESQNNMAEKTTVWLEAEKQKVKDAIDSSHRTLEKTLTGSYETFDNLSKHMEASSLLQEEFLTETNLLYETNTMLRKMEEDVDKAQTATAKKKIKEASEEIKALQEKEDVTKTELELAQAKYDVTLAQIALEEAQNAKSKVRLQRDSEGNFGYVYTADAEKVSKAEQDLADAENKLYNKALDAANEYGEKMLQTQAEMAEEYKKLEEDRWNGAFASEEEYQAAKDALETKYDAKFKAYSASYTAALNADSTAQKDTWTSNYTEMINKTIDAEGEQGTWKTIVQNSYTDVTTANTNYKNAVQGNKTLICEALGLEKKALDDNRISTDELKTATDKVTESSEDFAAELNDELIPDMKTALEEAEKLTAEYIDQKEAIDGAKESWIKYLLALGQEIKDVSKPEIDNPPGDDEGGDDESGGNEKGGNEDGGNEKGGNEGSTTLSPGSTVTVKPSATHFSRETGYGTTMRSYVPGNNFKVWKIDGDEVLIGDPSGPNYTASGVTGWVKKTDLVGFLTGGYTGAWGPAGKLAMLHEKELVLNQNDTTNFLSAVEMLRDIAHMIDLQAVHSQFTSMMMPMFSSTGMGDILEQQVQIEAHFPNVTSHSEIEEAFKNLINISSQYANRKL